MKKSSTIISFAIVIALASLQYFSNDFVKIINSSEVMNSGDLATMAKSDPDQYAWIKFAEFFKRVSPAAKTLTWETWINEDDVYEPACDVPRVWPTSVTRDVSNRSKKMSLVENIQITNGELATTDFMLLTLNFGHPYLEESRINRPMFDYIVNNRLYVRESMTRMAVERTIDLPTEAAIIKAQWKVITTTDKGKYLWHVISKEELESIAPTYDMTNVKNKVLIGLAAFHIVTKELPSFVWTTFEHVDNLGRCDYIGCSDSFGYSPGYVEPHKIDSLLYTEPAKVSDGLQALFATNDIDEIFYNYRLKSAQVDYLDKDGNPTLNGNSVLEANLVETSSCISCHARAAVMNDVNAGLMDMFDGSLSGTFQTGKKINQSLGWHPKCFNGKPVLRDYFPLDTLTGQVITDSIYYTTDFMWQFAQKSKKCGS